MTGVFTHLPQEVINISTLAFSSLQQIFSRISLIYGLKELNENSVQMNSKYFEYHRDSGVLIPATEKVIKPQPY